MRISRMAPTTRADCPEHLPLLVGAAFTRKRRSPLVPTASRQQVVWTRYLKIIRGLVGLVLRHVPANDARLSRGLGDLYP